MIFKNFFLLLIFILLISCSSKEISKSVIEEKSLELQVLEAYNEGKKALELNDVLYAAKKFNEAEILFPQSEYAPRAALMAAYSYYSQDYYGDAIAEIDRFIRVYPNHPRIDYAEYLLGLCFYEQIVDEKKDLQSITDAKITFQSLIRKYPKTDFAIDAEYKLDLINDILAAKEIYIGRYYIEKKNGFLPLIDLG